MTLLTMVSRIADGMMASCGYLISGTTYIYGRELVIGRARSRGLACSTFIDVWCRHHEYGG